MGKERNKTRNYAAEQTPQPDKKTFHLKDLTSIYGKTDNQRKLIESYLQTDVETFLATGYPGTGKTFLACWLGMNDVLDENEQQDRLIIIRSAVETRKLGYRPGTEQDKESVFETPYPPIFQSIFSTGHQKNYYNLKDNGYIEFHTTSNQRGVTFDNAVVIIDEAQNMTFDEIETIYTRTGENCRIIICADMGQNDLTHYKGETSGLPEFKRVLETMSDVSFHEFYKIEDIVRSGRIRDFIRAKIKLGMI